jgi:hypothetical protein
MKYIIYLINLIIILSLYKVNADTALGACGPVPILPNFDATKVIIMKKLLQKLNKI